MSINNGQDANEENFNKAFGSKMNSNTFVGVQSLDNAASGEKIANLQKCINTILETLGASELAENNGDYENNNYVGDGDSRKVAISKLDGALKALADVVGSLAKPSFENLGVVTIEEGGTFTGDPLLGLMTIKASGLSAAVNASLTPFGAEPALKQGAVITMVGAKTAFPVTFKYADIDGGIVLNGDRELSPGASFTITWDSIDKRFYQVA